MPNTHTLMKGKAMDSIGTRVVCKNRTPGVRTHLAMTIAYRMRKALLIALAVLCVYVLAACQHGATPTATSNTVPIPTTTLVTTTIPTPTTVPTTTTVIHEDDPRWDCATMGNRVCGPTTIPNTVATPTTLAPTTLEVRCAYAVAKAMGIHYTYEDGATERLDEFSRRTYQCSHDGALPQ